MRMQIGGTLSLVVNKPNARPGSGSGVSVGDAT
jgi:hypothetical protein